MFRYLIVVLLFCTYCHGLNNDGVATHLVKQLQLNAVGFSTSTAQYLATLCAISYCETDNIKTWKCPQCDKNLGNVQVFVSAPEKFISYVIDNNRDQIIVVFKGTEPVSWAQWATDLNIDYSKFGCGTCQVHAGFLYAMNSQRESINRALTSARARLPNAQVVVTGHSLGGAIATLYATYILQTYSISPLLYIFGAPRVGDETFSNFFNGLVKSNQFKAAYRINNDRDIVPHVPPTFTGFKHAGTLVFCVADTRCNVIENQENDNGFLHVSIPDHGRYLGVNYFDYISLGFQSLCRAR